MNNQPKSLVFVDASISNYQQLMEGMDSNAEVILINGHQDGIEVITHVLAQRHNLKNIQILSHGSEGALYLGNSKLDSGSLQDYSLQLGAWGKAMADGADFLLYGCNVAAGNEGKSFVEELSQYIGRDVAASEDLTGSSVRGGDWDLELKTGDIEPRSALVPEVRNGFNGVLYSAIIYDDAGFGGSSQTYYGTYYFTTNLGNVGNDRLSSIKVNNGYRATLYEDDSSSSDSISYTGNTSYVGDNWNDRVTGIKIEKIPPSIKIQPLSSSVREGNNAQFQIVASNSNSVSYDVEVNISYSTNNISSNKSVTLPAEQTSHSFSLPISDDNSYESGEKIRATLNYGRRQWPYTAEQNIIDNDMKVSLEGGGETLKEAEQGKTNLTLKISDGGFQETTRVYLNGGSSDLSFSNPITVRAGVNSVNIPVTVVNDTLAEINPENIQISVWSDSNSYRLGDNTSVNITVEDNEPEIGITSNVTGIIEEAGATGEFTINFTKPNPNDNFELKFRVEGTAKHGTLQSPTADSDYKLFYDALDENGKNLISNSLNPGKNQFQLPEKTKSIKLRVQPINDELWELDETVKITLLDHAQSTSDDKQYYKIDSNKNTATFTIKDNEPTVSLGKVVMPEEGFGFGSTIQELGKALALDGNGHVSVPSSEKLDLSTTGEFTQEAWIYPTGSGKQAIFGDAAYQTNNQKAYPRLWTTEKQGVKAGFGDGQAYHELSSQDNVLNPNSWNHVAATFDGTDYKIYVNGVEIVSTDKYKGKKPDNSQQFDIGRNGENDYFQGAIDEVRLWNVARTPGEIQNAMVTPLTGEETGLIGYWSFENNTNDSSGNDNHGTYVDDIFITPNNGNNENKFIDSQANPDNKNLGKTLYFTGQGERQAITRIFDTTVTENITFELIFSDGTNGGEAAEEGKDVVLEYSTDDGNNWRQLAIYDTENYTQWTTIQETIPEDARTPKTQFRWRQLGSGLKAEYFTALFIWVNHKSVKCN